MNIYDERYEIRHANLSDVDDIMKFISNHWSKRHIMSQDKDLFMYEYADGNNINFILAIAKKSQQIEGIFGYLLCSHTKDPGKKDIWGSIWKVNNTHDNIPLLGIELAKRAAILTQCRTHIGNGANPETTIPLRRLFFHEKGVKMKHYYLLNQDIEDFKIALIKNIPSSIVTNTYKTTLQEYKSINEVMNAFDVEKIDAIPYKDNWYINKRYFFHPYYKYKVYGIQSSTKKIDALLMTREIEHSCNKVLRIVDYIGNQHLFAGLSCEFTEFIKKNQYEYIDFYTHGFDDESILTAGFRLRTCDDPNIIPNYFEPFLRENVDIYAHYKIDGTLFFKADGDQDRPNMIK